MKKVSSKKMNRNIHGTTVLPSTSEYKAEATRDEVMESNTGVSPDATLTNGPQAYSQMQRG